LKRVTSKLNHFTEEIVPWKTFVAFENWI